MWYYGYIQSPILGPHIIEVFRSRKKPTVKSHGHLYGMVVGPFRNKYDVRMAIAELKRYSSAAVIVKNGEVIGL